MLCVSVLCKRTHHACVQRTGMCILCSQTNNEITRNESLHLRFKVRPFYARIHLMIWMQKPLIYCNSNVTAFLVISLFCDIFNGSLWSHAISVFGQIDDRYCPTYSFSREASLFYMGGFFFSHSHLTKSSFTHTNSLSPLPSLSLSLCLKQVSYS